MRLTPLALILAGTLAVAAPVVGAMRASTDPSTKSSPPEVAVLDLDTGHSCVVPLTSDGEPAGIDCDWTHVASSIAADPLPFADGEDHVG